MGTTNYDSLSTEQINPHSKKLDFLSPARIVQLMNREDLHVVRAVGMVRPQITRAITLIVTSMRKGGRLIFVGAGTSGRLGIIEAAECPPTFNTSPTMIQAIMAGGRQAVFQSIEGAEDSQTESKRALAKMRLGMNDTIVG